MLMSKELSLFGFMDENVQDVEVESSHTMQASLLHG